MNQHKYHSSQFRLKQHADWRIGRARALAWHRASPRDHCWQTATERAKTTDSTAGECGLPAVFFPAQIQYTRWTHLNNDVKDDFDRKGSATDIWVGVSDLVDFRQAFCATIR